MKKLGVREMFEKFERIYEYLIQMKIKQNKVSDFEELKSNYITVNYFGTETRERDPDLREKRSKLNAPSFEKFIGEMFETTRDQTIKKLIDRMRDYGFLDCYERKRGNTIHYYHLNFDYVPIEPFDYETLLDQLTSLESKNTEIEEVTASEEKDTKIDISELSEEEKRILEIEE